MTSLKKKKHPLDDKRVNIPLAGIGGLLLGIVGTYFFMKYRRASDNADWAQQHTDSSSSTQRNENQDDIFRNLMVNTQKYPYNAHNNLERDSMVSADDNYP